MSRAFTLICLTTMVLSGCAPATTTSIDAAALAQPTMLPATTTETATDGRCPVTQPIRDEPAKDPNADPFGLGEYYINTARTMWVAAQSWRVGGHKVIWIRPAGTDLVVTGRRLDAQDAPPLHAVIPCCYPTGFQVTGLYFPTEGCWEIIAEAGDSELRFVAKVVPADGPMQEGTCASLADAVERSGAIVVGRVTETITEGHYAWHEVSVIQSWKPRGGGGYGISLFQDLRFEPALEKDGQYLLFLQEGHWRLLCAQRSVMKDQANQAIPLGDDPLWPGGTMTDLRREIDRLLATP